MFSTTNSILIDLRTAEGIVFSGKANSVEIKTRSGVVSVIPRKGSFLNLVEPTEITLRSSSQWKSFLLHNAAVNFRRHRLTILAESIRPADATPCESSDPGL